MPLNFIAQLFNPAVNAVSSILSGKSPLEAIFGFLKSAFPQFGTIGAILNFVFDEKNDSPEAKQTRNDLRSIHPNDSTWLVLGERYERGEISGKTSLEEAIITIDRNR